MGAGGTLVASSGHETGEGRGPRHAHVLGSSQHPPGRSGRLEPVHKDPNQNLLRLRSERPLLSSMWSDAPGFSRNAESCRQGQASRSLELRGAVRFTHVVACNGALVLSQRSAQRGRAAQTRRSQAPHGSRPRPAPVLPCHREEWGRTEAPRLCLPQCFPLTCHL